MLLWLMNLGFAGGGSPAPASGGGGGGSIKSTWESPYFKGKDVLVAREVTVEYDEEAFLFGVMMREAYEP